MIFLSGIWVQSKVTFSESCSENTNPISIFDFPGKVAHICWKCVLAVANLDKNFAWLEQADFWAAITQIALERRERSLLVSVDACPLLSLSLLCLVFSSFKFLTFDRNVLRILTENVSSTNVKHWMILCVVFLFMHRGQFPKWGFLLAFFFFFKLSLCKF